jgi:phage shock protein A
MEDPEENVEAAWQKQLELLQRLKGSLYKIRTTRLYMEGQLTRITYEKKQAKQRDNQSIYLQNKKIRNLQRDIEELKSKENYLNSIQRELETRIEEYRIKRDILKKRYSAVKLLEGKKKSKLDTNGDALKAKHHLEKLNETVLELEAGAAAIDELVKDGFFDN